MKIVIESGGRVVVIMRPEMRRIHYLLYECLVRRPVALWEDQCPVPHGKTQTMMDPKSWNWHE